MNRHLLFSIAVCCSLLVPSVGRADAASDLADGQAALARGELDRAVELLTVAAQELPQSVEAQLALAECLLKRGDFEPAVEQYRKVLKLSPNHAAAKRIVAALTGNDTSVEQQMEAARSFVDAGNYGLANALLTKLIAQPISDSQRHSAMLLLAESQLAGNPRTSFEISVRLIHESDDAAIVGSARVLAAFALLIPHETPSSDVSGFLEAAQDLAEPWNSRAELAGLLLDLQDSTKAADVSNKLAGPLARIHFGAVRERVLNRAEQILKSRAEALLAHGDHDGALAILWPMIGSGPIPKSDAVLKPIQLEGGWLIAPDNARLQRFGNWLSSIAGALANVGRSESSLRGPQATLLGTWLAAEALQHYPAERCTFAETVVLAQSLAGLSRTAHDRVSGSPLSTADRIQRQLIFRLAKLAESDEGQNKAVDLLLGQLNRYEQAGDLETGLAQFATVDTAADPPTIQLMGELATLPPGNAHAKLLQNLARSYTSLGQKEYEKAAATLAKDANKTVNNFDKVALTILGKLTDLYPPNTECQTHAAGIIERYVAALRWDAANAATRIFYAPQQGDAGTWAQVQLKIRQATHAEDLLLAANRQLGEQLSPLVTEALSQVLEILRQRQAEPTKQQATAVAESLVFRYAGFARRDLAEAVIAAMTADQEVAALADWAIWTRSRLLAGQAAEALAAASQEYEAAANMPLHELHKAELELLGKLLEQHAESAYRQAAVERVVAISTTYRNHGSFDAALAVLTDFVDAHPNLSTTRRFEYQAVEVLLTKAQTEFQKRPARTKPPEHLSDEYAAAIEAIAAFLKEYPTGEFVPDAEQQLFQIARTYGQVGAWPVSRDVLDRFTAAVPDYRSGAHLRLLKAVTFLGELDRDYALGLLTPKPEHHAQPDGPVDVNGTALTAPYGTTASRLSGGGGGFGPTDPTLPTPPAFDIPQSGEMPPDYPPGSIGGGLNLDPSLGDRWRDPSESALALIRQSQQSQLQRIAMLDQQLDFGENETSGRQGGQQSQQPAAQQARTIALPTGSVLSEAEMQRQDEAADAAYAILIDLAKNLGPDDVAVAQQARAQIMWLLGFFEGQLRFDRAIALIDRYLTDLPGDPAKITLAYRAIEDQLGLATARKPTERINLAWLDARHELFEKARETISKFITDYKDKTDWIHRAQLLTVESFDREAQLASSVSAVRAGGLLVRSAEALLSALSANPQHPAAADIPQRLWNLADRLGNLQQQDQAIYVLSQLPIRFPTHHLANQAVLRTAQFYAANMANPLKAVERYQEYLSLNGADESIRSQIYSIGQQLAGQRRYLEALHVFGVFVDSFPNDPRAPEALQAVGQTHQANESWQEAIGAYRRILDEYPHVGVVAGAKLLIGECQINLSQWREARLLYEEFVANYPDHGQVATAQSRLTVLKNLERFQALLADDAVDRNKDDAQFQIGRIVLQELSNPVKAVAEFRKVVEEFPHSDVADDAQLEIGKALLSLDRLDEARAALLDVPRKFPNSPAADDALYLVGQSYEQQAERLASVTVAAAREEAFVRNQRFAYQAFNELQFEQERIHQERRVQLKAEGKQRELGLDEAANAFRFGNGNFDNITITSNTAGIMAETESALQIANRQDRVNEALREAVAAYAKAAADYPLGDRTDDSLLRVAQIYETNLKDRDAAMQTYQKIVKLFPGTPVAEDAAWTVATFYEQERKYAAATAAYREFIRNYPGSPRVADAQFSLAEVLEHLGQWVDAMDAYEVFRQKFGQHPKARLAVDQINWIKTYRRN